MLFFAEERGLRKEEDDLEEKEFVFVVVVVANITISVFPSFCGDCRTNFCCFVVVLLSFFFFFAFYFSLSSALFPFFSSSPTKQTDKCRRVASLSYVIIVRKGNNLLASLNTRKTKKSELLSPSLCACVIRLCKDLLRFELPLL